MHMPPDNKRQLNGEFCYHGSVEEDGRSEKHMQKSRRVWVFTVCTQRHTRAWVSVWVWRDGWAVCFRLGGNTKKKKNSISEESTPLKDQIPPYSSSLHLSLKRPPAETEASNCFGCIFRLESSPAATNRLLLTVLFEQLQQGNVSTAFQAQALCGYVSVFYQAFRCINTQTGSTQHAL